MKKLLLIIATLALMTNSEEIHADNAYVSVAGGLNWFDNTHHDGLSTKFDNGYTGVGTIGFLYNSGVRLEAEYGYRYNKVDKTTLAGENLHLHGKVTSWSTMANVLYNIPVDCSTAYYIGNLQPYIGAGLGYAHYHTHLHNTDETVSSDDHADGLTHQLIAGFQLPIDCCLSLDTKYRYQKTHHLSHNQSVEIGLVYAF